MALVLLLGPGGLSTQGRLRRPSTPVRITSVAPGMHLGANYVDNELRRWRVGGQIGLTFAGVLLAEPAFGVLVTGDSVGDSLHGWEAMLTLQFRPFPRGIGEWLWLGGGGETSHLVRDIPPLFVGDRPTTSSCTVSTYDVVAAIRAPHGPIAPFGEFHVLEVLARGRFQAVALAGVNLRL
jgi:hypothetical protein